MDRQFTSGIALNDQQREAVGACMTARNCFVTGGAGVGKSVALDHVVRALRSQGKSVVVCAPTGVAALNVGGMTLHRAFRARLGPLVGERGPYVPETILYADAVVIDEIGMVRRDMFDHVSAVLDCASAIRSKRGRRPTQLVVVGDFAQLPPVVGDNELDVLREHYGSSWREGCYAFQSEWWDRWSFAVVELTEVIRQGGDGEYAARLNALRLGDVSALDWIEAHASIESIPGAIHLTGHNAAADKINSSRLGELAGRARVFEARCVGDIGKGDMPAPQSLPLKAGARVVAVRNDTQHGRYVNGSLGTIASVGDGVARVDWDNGSAAELEPATWEKYDYTLCGGGEEDARAGAGQKRKRLSRKKVGSFTQLPVKLAWAMTIHKGQGQTFEACNVDPCCFACGQLYVALSRCRSVSGLHLTEPIRPEWLMTSPDVAEFIGSGYVPPS